MGIGGCIGVTMARKVQCDEGTLQGERDRVEGMGVLGTTVDHHQLGILVTPGETTQLSKSVDAHEEPPNVRDRYLEVPLCEVLVKQGEFVVRVIGRAWHRRRWMLEMWW